MNFSTPTFRPPVRTPSTFRCSCATPGSAGSIRQVPSADVPDRATAAAREVPRPTVATPMSLTELAAQADLAAPSGDVPITGVTANTAFVHAGDVFAGVPGRTAHGARYAAAAIAAGAVAVLTDA